MTGRENEPQQIVADIVFARGIERIDEIGRDVRFLRVEIASVLLVLARVQRVLPQTVERLVLRCRHEPRSRLFGHAHARLAPVLQRGDERVLRQFLGERDIAHHARHARNHLRGLDAPHRVDGAPGRIVRRALLVPAPAHAASGFMCTSSQIWPSRSSKPWPYMKP